LVPDGAYYWRVRGLTASKERGAWSSVGHFTKAWSAAPQLLGPASGAAITWPAVPLALGWTAVPYATEYIVTIATDPGLSNIVLGSATTPEKTSATVFALPKTLSVGQYYWAITPVDSEGHRGTRSAIRSFSWSWPTGTSTEVRDLNADPRIFEPQFSWAPVAGAAKYEVEVNSASEFPLGSKWCCSDLTTGTSLSPTENLANNEYYWRVRAIDPSGNAGEWNYGHNTGELGFGPAPGAPFTKAFDSVTPTIPNLTLSDMNGNPLPAGTATAEPLITWSPAPGAASYEIQVAPYVGKAGCNWAAPFDTEKQIIDTSVAAWAPLGELSTRIGPSAWPAPVSRRNLNTGTYCARVLARSDGDAKGNQVVSEWTQVGGPNQPAFTFASQPPPGPEEPSGLETRAGDYLPPHTGTSLTPGEATCGLGAPCRLTPFFSWKRVPGASSYYVVIARDKGFTHVVDVASTVVPAYAPALGGEEPLDDETTTYYWAVVPVNAAHEEFREPPEDDARQEFNKSSIPPTPLGPTNGASVNTQPTFSWTPAEGALNYTLQVSQDPTFGAPIDNVRTDSTAYTSSSTYPPSVVLYWRVRANDTNTHTEGLHWSAVQTFRRTLTTPTPTGNPAGGQAIPVLSWTPVTGAIAYEVHIELANGVTKDLTVHSTSFTPTETYGPGIWRWGVRAAFPTNSFGTISSGYSEPSPFVATLAPPGGAVGVKAGSRTTISWTPDPYAREYEVQIATSDTFSFSSGIESRRVDGASWAPDIDFTRPANRGPLFWRVAAIDGRGNLGPFASGSFVRPKAKPRCVVKKVKLKSKKVVKKCVSRKHAKKKKQKKKHG
jgi:hypothetical protein